MKKFGFIGAGNMGLPLLQGAVKLYGAENVTFRCATEKSNQRIKESTKVEYCSSLVELVKNSEIIVLAVKPQFFGDVLPIIKENTFVGQIVISLSPGVTVDYLSESTGGKTKIIEQCPYLRRKL